MRMDLYHKISDGAVSRKFLLRQNAEAINPETETNILL